MNEFEKQVAAAFIDVGAFLAIINTLHLFKLPDCEHLFNEALGRIKKQNFPPEVIDDVTERLEGLLVVKAKEEELLK
jgi:hypothetical protein